MFAGLVIHRQETVHRFPFHERGRDDFGRVVRSDVLVKKARGLDHHYRGPGTEAVATGGLDLRHHLGRDLGGLDGPAQGLGHCGAVVGQAAGAVADDDHGLVGVALGQNLVPKGIQILG